MTTRRAIELTLTALAAFLLALLAWQESPADPWAKLGLVLVPLCLVLLLFVVLVERDRM